MSDNSLKWRFDVNTFRLIGRDLITDRITAVFELVKNCYDANSTEVNVEFYNVSIRSETSAISIIDNGIGMSFFDIRDKWMVVGTNSKRKEIYSPPPFNRKYVGEKGIGRFAVDKLGEKLIIQTKKKGEKKWLNVKINWAQYEQEAKSSQANDQLSLFTEVENKYYYEDGDIEEHGTRLIIYSIHDSWAIEDIERLNKELSKLISPFYPVFPPLEIYIKSNEYDNYNNRHVKADPIRFFSHQANIDYDLLNGKQEVLKFQNN